MTTLLPGTRLCSVAILAGGEGTRLRERTGPLPKPMVKVLGKPLLQHQLESCKRDGFLDIALLVHYHHEMISDYFGDGTAFGVRLKYLVEATPRGTAGALRDALPNLAPTFLVLYGDTYFDVDLAALRKAHDQSGADGTLFLHPNDHPQDSDLIEVNRSGEILAVHPYPHPAGHPYRNLVNAGLYVLNGSALAAFLPETGKADLAKKTFPMMLLSGQVLKAYISPEYIKDLGTPERLDKVVSNIVSGHVERLSGRDLRDAIFLDRDGTLNREVGHLNDLEDLELLPGVAQAISRINQAGRLAIGITNQPVVARGELSIEGLEKVHARLENLLGQGHAYLDAIYTCPHHPHKGFPGEVPELKIDCTCRKPGTGLIDTAARELKVRRSNSWFIGDMTSDIEAGRSAGLRTVLVRTGYAGSDGKHPFRPDFITPDLSSAVAWCLEGHASMNGKLLPFLSANLAARTILVGGLSRTGKSFAAQVLKDLFYLSGRRAHIICLDSWLHPRSCRTEGAGVLNRYDMAEAYRFLSTLVGADTRKGVELPIYDPGTRGFLASPKVFSVGPEDVIIVEGVTALAYQPLVDLADAKLFLEIDEDLRLERLVSDYGWRGFSREAIDGLLASRAIDELATVRSSASTAVYVLSLKGRA